MYAGDWCFFQRGWSLAWSALSCSYSSSWFSSLTLLMLGMKNGSASMRIRSPKLGWPVCQLFAELFRFHGMRLSTDVLLFQKRAFWFYQHNFFSLRKYRLFLFHFIIPAALRYARRGYSKAQFHTSVCIYVTTLHCCGGWFVLFKHLCYVYYAPVGEGHCKLPSVVSCLSICLWHAST